MRHYFITSEHDKSDYFKFSEEVLGEKFTFNSCDDVFSKDQLDYGSLVLIKTIIKNNHLYSGEMLDMCCGYGTIGIILKKFLRDVSVDMCDINELAVDLAKLNIKENAVEVNTPFVSDMWGSVEKKYKHIVSNPPIKTGKKKLLEFVDGSYQYLLDSGSLTVVIKKNLGADSLKNYLKELFGNCDVLERDKGYYILYSVKN